MVKVWFPNMYMRLIKVSALKKPLPEAVLYVAPKMTKFEIKEYLTKIYNIPVIKVATANYLGMEHHKEKEIVYSVIYSYIFLPFRGVETIFREEENYII